MGDMKRDAARFHLSQLNGNEGGERKRGRSPFFCPRYRDVVSSAIQSGRRAFGI